MFSSHAARADGLSAIDQQMLFGESVEIENLEQVLALVDEETADEIIGNCGGYNRCSIRLDRKAHNFTTGPLRGRRAHFQMDVWKDGVKRSNKTVFRIPLWRVK